MFVINGWGEVESFPVRVGTTIDDRTVVLYPHFSISLESFKFKRESKFYLSFKSFRLLY